MKCSILYGGLRGRIQFLIFENCHIFFQFFAVPDRFGVWDTEYVCSLILNLEKCIHKCEEGLCALAVPQQAQSPRCLG